MPRQSGRRPAPAPARRAAPQQSRSAHTQAAPPVAAQHQTPAAYPAAPAQTKQPGMFAQMASTAAGVAVGSSIGHTVGAGLSSIFGGGSSAPAEPQQQQQQVAPQQYAQEQEGSRTCAADARNFTRCLDDNQGNFQVCEYYLQQLKACQEAARQF